MVISIRMLAFAIICLPGQCYGYNIGRNFAFNFRLQGDMINLGVGDIHGGKFTKIRNISTSIGLFNISATIPSFAYKYYLNDYKVELKASKKIFPGFRPGKFPPHEYTGIQMEILKYGIDGIIKHLCDLNKVAICPGVSSIYRLPRYETRNDIPFIPHVYLESQHEIPFDEYCTNYEDKNDFEFKASFLGTQDSSLYFGSKFNDHHNDNFEVGNDMKVTSLDGDKIGKENGNRLQYTKSSAKDMNNRASTVSRRMRRGGARGR